MSTPNDALQLIGTQVEISLVDGTTVFGRVYTIDPETGNFILMNNSSTIFIPSVNIARYDVRAPNELGRVDLSALQKIDERYFPSSATNKVSEEDCERNKERLIAHFEKHRVPVDLSREGEVIVAGVVRCMPPYDRNSCYSTNDIVLGRIQNILKSFDSDLL